MRSECAGGQAQINATNCLSQMPARVSKPVGQSRRPCDSRRNSVANQNHPVWCVVCCSARVGLARGIHSKLQGLSHPSKCARRQGNPPKTRGWERIHPSPRPNPTTHHRQCTGHHQHPSRLVQPNPAQSPALGWVGEVGPTANSSSRSTLHPHSPPPSHSSAGQGVGKVRHCSGVTQDGMDECLDAWGIDVMPECLSPATRGEC